MVFKEGLKSTSSCRSSRDWLILLSCQKYTKACRYTVSAQRIPIPAVADPLRRPCPKWKEVLSV